MRIPGPYFARRIQSRLLGLLVVGLACLGPAALRAAAPNRPPARPTKTTPNSAASAREALHVLRDECLACHNPEKKKGGLDLSQREAALKPGDDGPALVPGQPTQSRLLQLVAPGADPHMPPKGQLDPAQINALTRWIQSGAPWDAAALELDLEPNPAFEPLPPSYHPTFAVALSPDTRLLAAGRGATLWLLDLARTNPAPPLPVQGTLDPVQALAWSPDGQRLAVGTHGRIQLRRLPGLTLERDWTNGLGGRVNALRFSPDGTQLAAALGNPARPGYVHLLPLAETQRPRHWRAHGDAVLSLSFSADGTRLVTGGADRLVRVWDAARQTEIAALEGHAAQVLGVAFNTNATQVVSGAADRELKVWDVTSRENLIRLGQHAGAVTAVSWPGTGTAVFATTDQGGVLRYTNLKSHTGEQSSATGDERSLAQLPDPVLCLDVAADGTLVCAGTHDGVVTVRDADGKERLRFPPADPAQFATLEAAAATAASGLAPSPTTPAPTATPSVAKSALRRKRAATQPLPRGSRVVALTAEPISVQLTPLSPQHGVRLTARLADGFEVDATDAAEWRVPAQAPFALDDQGRLVATGAGSNVLTATWGKLRVELPVTVTGPVPDTHQGQTSTRAEPDVSFVRDVLPVLNRAGCSGGSCHAKPDGQNGFKLSVFSYDPRHDLGEILKDARGRRVFPAAPDASLLLQKALGQVPHEGGTRFTNGSAPHQLLRHWIRSGLPFTAPGEATLDHVTVFPSDRRYPQGAVQRLLVQAHYSDGTIRDVTDLAAFISSDKEIAQVDDHGRVTAGRQTGAGVVVARYMGLVAPARITVPALRRLPPEQYTALPRHNFIDTHAWTRLQELGLYPSAPCTDAEFLRRVSLDITGTLPTPGEVKTFLADCGRDPQASRAALVERLLQRPEFAEYWANQWADLLRPNPDRVGVKSVLLLDEWLRASFRSGRPLDQFVRDILLAEGSTHREGPAVIYRDRREPSELTTLFSQLFLGVRLECAKCHHHPNERWSQDDFYQLAAYFGPVRSRGAGLSPPISAGTENFYFAPGGTVKHPVTQAVLSPRALDAPTGTPVDPAVDPRRALADWLTATNNAFFAQAAVNRVWAGFFGRGLVDPVDDFRVSNPCVNPPLLEALAADFAAHGYDLRQLIRTVTASALYQLGGEPNATNLGDTKNFSRAYRRRLRAEVLLDAITDLTGVPEKFNGLPPGSRAVQAWTYKTESQFLDAFSRPNPSSDPPCERDRQMSVVQSLHLMNSKALQAKLADPAGRARQLAGGTLEPADIVRELYLATLSRLPDPTELATATATFRLPDATRQTATEDVLWALLNSAEFVFNH
jgi:WD40 repeat protein